MHEAYDCQMSGMTKIHMTSVDPICITIRYERNVALNVFDRF